VPDVLMFYGEHDKAIIVRKEEGFSFIGVSR
jgi:hypothetical protein